MRTLSILAALAALNSGSALAEAPDARVPVDLRLAGHDGLTQKLAASLRSGLGKHPFLRLLANGEEVGVIIGSDSSVGWDTLGGRKVVIYSVYVYRPNTQAKPITGVCFESGMSKCAKDILRIANIRAEFR